MSVYLTMSGMVAWVYVTATNLPPLLSVPGTPSQAINAATSFSPAVAAAARDAAAAFPAAVVKSGGHSQGVSLWFHEEYQCTQLRWLLSQSWALPTSC